MQKSRPHGDLSKAPFVKYILLKNLCETLLQRGFGRDDNRDHLTGEEVDSK